ncbi:hypothetical protein TYRP_014909 [Tyrophagus putrescentiae]|nr:hypothetical protein TYRP_014909 [Tyrophagus putrescentiae]
MKLFTLCAFALTLAIVGVVADSDAAENSQQQHSGIERGSEVEFLDKEGSGSGSGKAHQKPIKCAQSPHPTTAHHRLNYWKDSLVKNFEKYGSNPHISTFYKTIYVRKCSYYSGEEEDFGFNIHYLLKVSACRVLREQNDGQTFGNTTWKTTTRAHRDCSSLPSTVARCEADLLSDRVHFRGCELDNLEKSNPSA